MHLTPITHCDNKNSRPSCYCAALIHVLTIVYLGTA
jgi:hypothetical protein